jgi:hypothetical protein
MANDSQRDKARATFGKTFFENSKALPNPKNAAAALQKRANDRPIPTYKVGGAVKKATPPQPTAAEREADRKRRESLANTKVTQSEADALGRAMRSEGPRYKDGGKANAGAKRAMKAEQDFTGLMRDAAARAAAKGTPVMKDGGATNEYTAKRVMSRIKAGNFKEGGRAELLRDRRMKDIEKDYKIALAKGKNEGVAKAKYEQRKADAADDYAKRTNADRTATRAAEKASEATLKEARRTKGMSMLAKAEPKAVTTEASVAKVTDSLGAMSVPKMDKSIGAKPVVRKPVQKIVQRPVQQTTPSTADLARQRAKIAASDLPSDQGFGGKSRVLGASKPPAVAAPPPTPKTREQVTYEKFLADRDRKLGESFSVFNPFSNAKERAAAYTAKLKAAGKLAKGGKVEKYAAGGAGKVRKGMMKGK